MATATATPVAEAALPTASGGRKKKLILLAGPLVALVAAWYLLLGPGSGGGEDAHAEPVAGEVVPLEAITMNLADGRLLKVGIALQLVEGAGGDHGPISGSIALDETITFLGEHTYAQLAAPAGRAKAKAELSARVAERYHQEVLEVYFTEFVMQ
jgi:flagellar FliL protein